MCKDVAGEINHGSAACRSIDERQLWTSDQVLYRKGACGRYWLEASMELGRRVTFPKECGVPEQLDVVPAGAPGVDFNLYVEIPVASSDCSFILDGRTRNRRTH